MARTQIDKSLIASVDSSSLIGTTTNNSAAAGVVGEYLTTTASSQNAAANGTYTDMGNLALTAGDWDVTLVSYVNRNTATWTRVDAGISTNIGNSGAGLNPGNNMASGEWASSATTPSSFNGCIAEYRVSISSPTTHYAKLRCDYSAGTPQYSFRMSARRVR